MVVFLKKESAALGGVFIAINAASASGWEQCVVVRPQQPPENLYPLAEC